MSRNEIDKDLQDLQHKYKDDAYKAELVSQLIDMVHIATKLFGPRNLYYTVIDIGFGGNQPEIQYPSENHPYIIIRLSAKAKKDRLIACYQMAHETVHLLAPTSRCHVTNLEEGVASYFAIYYMKNYYKGEEKELNNYNWEPDDPRYIPPLKKVTRLFEKDKYFVSELRRKSQHLFQDITAEGIINIIEGCA